MNSSICVKCCLYVFIMILSTTLTYSKSWIIGPDETYTNPCDITSMVNDGDTILIRAAIYEMTGCKWNNKNLTFIGLSNEIWARPILHSDVFIENDKGIFVFENPNTTENITIHNLHFLGARALSGNGAGVRYQSKNLTINNCVFEDCENGILEGHGSVTNSIVRIENSRFYMNGNTGYEHHIYISASTDTLYVSNTYFQSPKNQAHCIKSRAKNAFILYNFIDESTGRGSHEINIAQGGTNVIMGNVIIQGKNSANHAIIGYDETSHASQHFYFVHNTVINEYGGNNIYFHFPSGDQITTCKIYNNLFVSTPTSNDIFIQGSAPPNLDEKGNKFYNHIDSVGFVDYVNQNYQLSKKASLLIDAGVDAGLTMHNFALTPLYSYKSYDQSLLPRTTVGLFNDIGAYEYSPISSIHYDHPKISVFPNPTYGDVFVYAQDVPSFIVSCYNSFGYKIYETSSLHHTISIHLDDQPSGIYYIIVTQNGKTLSYPIIKMHNE